MAFQLHEATALLERTPRTLKAMLSGLPEAWVEANEGPETFSARDVLGHLISGEEHDWIPRARIIMDHGESKPFEPFDRFAFRKDHGRRSMEELLGLFDRLRMDNLAALHRMNLGEPQLDRTGMHPSLGRVTLRQLLATWAVHDLTHIRQIVRVMARRYDAAVGPWKGYLGILNVK